MTGLNKHFFNPLHDYIAKMLSVIKISSESLVFTHKGVFFLIFGDT